MLFRLVAAIGSTGAVIRSAVVGTLGAEAVDVFSLVDAQGKQLSDDDALGDVVNSIYAALAAPG